MQRGGRGIQRSFGARGNSFDSDPPRDTSWIGDDDDEGEDEFDEEPSNSLGQFMMEDMPNKYGRSSSNKRGGDLSGPSQHTTGTYSTAVPTKERERERSVYDFIPQEYLYNPKTAEPLLHYLPKAAERGAETADEPVPLEHLLSAAEQDVRLHRARVQAGIDNEPRLLRTYQLEKDPKYAERRKRLEGRDEVVHELSSAQTEILEQLQDVDTRGLTIQERTQLQLARWQRALELFVFTETDLDWQSLFEKLLDGVSEDQDISQILADAGSMCGGLVDRTQAIVADASENVRDVESSYLIRLEAHQMFARASLQQVAAIEDQFRTSGRAALQIGHQLEHAEIKRSQCEAASTLIRRWWIMENLAESEANSGYPIQVEEEVRGVVAPTACRMDPLFTQPENSLDASKALKQLRAVVRSRGSAIASQATSAVTDKTSSRRFDLTANLITRTSDALEHRLLNSFSEVYAGGGTYDFSPKPRPGAIDWRELRALAQSLLLFDSGRNLHKRYVDMVVTSRFPELFTIADKGNESDEDEEEEEKDDSLDATRSKLSSLFRRVSDVCTAEFELIAHVFGAEDSRTDLLDGSEEMPLVVARALLQRVVSDPKHGLQARINDLLASIDRTGDFDAGAKKLDTFVVIHEKAAGLFSLLKDAAENMVPSEEEMEDWDAPSMAAARNAVDSLKGFLTSQQLALSNTHRQGYINLELRLLHHDCCNSLDLAGCALVKAPEPRVDSALAEKGILEEYRAPVLPLHKESLAVTGFTGILAGPLKQSVLRQPLIHATDSLGRARLMFGTNKRNGETTARVILSIYSQMCSFYGEGFLCPIVETIKDMLPTSAPSQPPQLPFDEEQDAPDLGVSPAFWVALERVHSASKAFDRELWSENRSGSERVWETLESCGDSSSLAIARDERAYFYSELERRGEAAILRALDTLSAHVQWVLVTGGESMLATGGTRIMASLTGSSGGPYAIPAGSSLETPNSPAVKSLTYCLRVQFVHVQAALTTESLAKFWVALSIRLYDILVARLLQHYYVSTVGAVILSRDVEALRSVAMLAGTNHSHWDTLRELITLYMTPPDAIKTMLIGPEGDSSKGLFAKVGREQCLVALSRRNDFAYKTASGPKKSGWVTEMLSELNITDSMDGAVNMNLFAAGRVG